MSLQNSLILPGWGRFPWAAKSRSTKLLNGRSVKPSPTVFLSCECVAIFHDDDDAIRQLFFVVAHTNFYTKDPVKYNARVVNRMVQTEAARLGLDLEGQNIWDDYPDCVPDS
ncbi:hypothetical protein F5Y19DRAFT_208669 [Xylariaceae sp. FL1651]|nr:hypothetical protein F5Y19DRAFT_208669 [Xylariaceae sp. FL1651]